MNPITGGVILSAVEALGDTALKKYAVDGGKLFLSAGMGIYILLSIILVQLFKTMGLAITNTYWDATSNLITMAIGFFIFKEKYTIRQWIGMFIVSIGIFLIDGF